MAIKKYTNGSWVPASYRKYGTETDTITTLPATVIGDGTPISSYIIKGNMEQTGTPTPSSPIYPSECGDLVASGEHAGQYKLPLTLGSTTTDIYLGEVQTTRRVKKLVLTGEESWGYESEYERFSTRIDGMYAEETRKTPIVCTHYPCVSDGRPIGNVPYNSVYIGASGQHAAILLVKTSDYTTITDFKAFLAQQYANGTPVTVWYILTTSTTGIVNEPIRKIGDYVDSVSGTGLATSGTAQQFDVGTTLKPSEVDLTYHGWHKHEDTTFTI